LKALLRHVNSRSLETQRINPKLPSDVQRFLKAKSRAASIDTMQWFILLGALESGSGILARYMMEHFDEPVSIKAEIPERLFSKQDL
jgi:hypothetical protein